MASSTDSSPVRFTGVTKRFSPTVLGLDDVTVEFPPNEVTVLLGLSGSGKSTLLRHINGLHRPTSGSVNVLATDVRVEQRSLEDVFLDITGKELRS